VTMPNIAASSPSVHTPYDSPRSLLTSMATMARSYARAGQVPDATLRA
jgi:hypothetical protein